MPDESERTGSEYTAPGNEVEKRLVEIWSGLFRVDSSEIGIDTNFFDFGGHSLKAALLAARMHREFNVKVPLVEIFTHPTIRELAGYILESAEDRYIPLKPAEKKEYYPLSSAQKRLFMLRQLEQESTAYNGPLVMMLEGRIDRHRLKSAFKELINRHESLRTSFLLIEGDPVQVIHPGVNSRFKYYITM